MTLKVIGAGLPRTATMSLQLALQHLFGQPCYHMSTVFGNPQHIKLWREAAAGKPDWNNLFSGYAAAVDYPAACFWRSLMSVYPDALVILSTRDAEQWWESCCETVYRLRGNTGVSEEWKKMMKELPSLIPRDVTEREEAIESFKRHQAEVIAEVPAQRLLVWRAEDGWEPLCRALNLPVPSIPFPRVNCRRVFRFRWWMISVMRKLGRLFG